MIKKINELRRSVPYASWLQMIAYRKKKVIIIRVN